jgi:hypothetical protein
MTSTYDAVRRQLRGRLSRLPWQSCRSRILADVQARVECLIPPKSRSASSRNTSSWCYRGLPNKTLHRHLGETQRRTCIRSFERLKLSYSSIQILLDLFRAPHSRSLLDGLPGTSTCRRPDRASGSTVELDHIVFWAAVHHHQSVPRIIRGDIYLSLRGANQFTVDRITI